MTRKQKLLALIPAYWAACFDIVITILHQPQAYWDGNLTMGNEGNPVGSFFMKNHSAGIFIISGAWLILVGALGYYLPRRVGRVFLLFTLIAHSFGASTWLSNYYGFWYSMTFILFNSILFYVLDDRVQKSNLTA